MATAQAATETMCSAIAPLPKRADFLRLRSGSKTSGKFFTLQSRSRPGSTDVIRVGLTVTTKVGIAVERNRIKRRLRAAVSQVFPASAKSGHDYVIIARRPVLRADFSHLANELRRALDRVHANGSKGGKSTGGLTDKAS